MFFVYVYFVLDRLDRNTTQYNLSWELYDMIIIKCEGKTIHHCIATRNERVKSINRLCIVLLQINWNWNVI